MRESVLSILINDFSIDFFIVLISLKLIKLFFINSFRKLFYINLNSNHFIFFGFNFLMNAPGKEVKVVLLGDSG
jgi:hypothetical protein